MKYGLIVFKETENLGDDIQSYAAYRLLPQVDYFIEREKLDLFCPDKKEYVLTIFNGWFLYNKTNFPPSPYIYPLYISTHFSEYSQNGITTEHINNYFKKSIKNYLPIGCRDTSTMKLLNSKKIANYFSGCLTLTIKPFNNIKKKNHILLVDTPKEIENIFAKQKKYDYKMETNRLYKDINSKLTWSERVENVENMLKKYQESKLVITTRLHCALPCLALDVPVILIYDNEEIFTKDRLGDYTKYIKSYNKKEFIKQYKKILSGKIENKDIYQIKENLLNIVKKFLSSKPKKIILPEINYFKEYYVEKKKNIDAVIEASKAKNAVDERKMINLEYAVKYWKKEYNILLLEMEKNK